MALWCPELKMKQGTVGMFPFIDISKNAFNFLFLKKKNLLAEKLATYTSRNNSLPGALILDIKHLSHTEFTSFGNSETSPF